MERKVQSILAARRRKGSTALPFKPSTKADNENAQASKLPESRQAKLVPGAASHYA